jgi:hypothetical protein
MYISEGKFNGEPGGITARAASQGKKKCNDFLPGAAFSNFFL